MGVIYSVSDTQGMSSARERPVWQVSRDVTPVFARWGCAFIQFRRSVRASVQPGSSQRTRRKKLSQRGCWGASVCCCTQYSASGCPYTRLQSSASPSPCRPTTRLRSTMTRHRAPLQRSSATWQKRCPTTSYAAGHQQCPSCQSLTGQACGRDCQAASHEGPSQAEGPRSRIFFRHAPKHQLVVAPRRSWTRVCAALWRLSA